MAFDAATFTVDPLSLTTPRARLEYLRDFLRTLPRDRFDIRKFAAESREKIDYGTAFEFPTRTELKHGCGTCACIAGWTLALFTKRGPLFNDNRAAELLGLTHQGADLFFPDSEEAWSEISPAQAADVIDHLIRTGEVNWSVSGSGQ